MRRFSLALALLAGASWAQESEDSLRRRFELLASEGRPAADAREAARRIEAILSRDEFGRLSRGPEAARVREEEPEARPGGMVVAGTDPASVPPGARIEPVPGPANPRGPRDTGDPKADPTTPPRPRPDEPRPSGPTEPRPGPRVDPPAPGSDPGTGPRADPPGTPEPEPAPGGDPEGGDQAAVVPDGEGPPAGSEPELGLGTSFGQLEPAIEPGVLARVFGLAVRGGVAIGLGALVAGLLFRRRSRAVRAPAEIAFPAPEGELPSSWRGDSPVHLTPEEWELDASREEGIGRWREAVRGVYQAALARLHRSRAIEVHPWFSNWDIVAGLASSPRRDALASLTELFERIWYGGRACERRDLERARSFARRALEGDGTEVRADGGLGGTS